MPKSASRRNETGNVPFLDRLESAKTAPVRASGGGKSSQPLDLDEIDPETGFSGVVRRTKRKKAAKAIPKTGFGGFGV